MLCALCNSISNTLCCTSHHNRDALHFQPQRGASPGGPPTNSTWIAFSPGEGYLLLDSHSPGSPQSEVHHLEGAASRTQGTLSQGLCLASPMERVSFLPLIYVGFAKKLPRGELKANKFQGYQEALVPSPGFWLLSSFHSSFNTQTLSDFGLSVLICKTRTAWPLALLTAKSGTKKMFSIK